MLPPPVARQTVFAPPPVEKLLQVLDDDSLPGALARLRYRSLLTDIPTAVGSGWSVTLVSCRFAPTAVCILPLLLDSM